MENPREIKGLEIAARYRITNQGKCWTVPSQSGKGAYSVYPEIGRCTCPDYEFTQSKCKHLFAVEFTIERERTLTVTEAPDGTTTTTVTEKETVKVTYGQQWPAYNKAQTQEKELFQKLLYELCKGVGEPAQYNGRPRLPLEDMIFSMAFKVYSTVSGRRFMSDLRDAHGRGYVSTVTSYNTLFRYFESETLTPYLKMLIEESALPLRVIEEDFAIDSSGLSTCRFVRWVQAKYKYHADSGLMSRGEQTLDKHEWVKLHIICGVKTNVVTAAEVTDRNAADTTYFKPLLDTTAENFYVRQVSADKAYLSLANLRTAAGHAASPYIPFKVDSVAKHKQDKTGLWARMFHYFSFEREKFAAQYHKRSNVESTFHMIKSKFGDALRSRTRTAQVNEALCKVLAHNICCLISAMFELGIAPTFWQEAA